jgi:hypothetical protein
VTAVALAPGWLRSELILEAFGVTEASWRDALRAGAPDSWRFMEEIREKGLEAPYEAYR